MTWVTPFNKELHKYSSETGCLGKTRYFWSKIYIRSHDSGSISLSLHQGVTWFSPKTRLLPQRCWNWRELLLREFRRCWEKWVLWGPHWIRRPISVPPASRLPCSLQHQSGPEERCKGQFPGCWGRKESTQPVSVRTNLQTSEVPFKEGLYVVRRELEHRCGSDNDTI